jgi:hypothetical protein
MISVSVRLKPSWIVRRDILLESHIAVGLWVGTAYSRGDIEVHYIFQQRTSLLQAFNIRTASYSLGAIVNMQAR